MHLLKKTCARVLVATLVGLFGAATARAEGQEPVETVSSSTDVQRAEALTPTAAPSRERCLCSPERLVKVGKEMSPSDPLAVVIDDDQHSLVDTFAGDFFSRGASSEDDARVAVTLEPFAGGPLTSSKRHLFRVSVDPAATPPFFIGLRRKKESVPKDVVKIAEGALSSVTAPTTLTSLFIGPDENREPRGCGPSRTRAVSFSTVAGSLPLAGFIVDIARTDGSTSRSFVDERHARSFGLGRVEPCDHGAPLDDATTAITVSPIGADLAVGDAWHFTMTERVPTLATAPMTRDDTIENPFTRDLPGQENAFSDESDKAALGTMVGLVGAAGVMAFMLWPALRRRRAVVKVACPACGTGLTLDLRDPSVDGGFCPSCGKASIFVSHRADGAPEARLFVLDGKKE